MFSKDGPRGWTRAAAGVVGLGIATLLMGAATGPPKAPTLLGAVSSGTPGFTVKMDFENFPLGAVAQGPGGFDDAAGESIVGKRAGSGGAKAVQLHVRQGQTGWGNWGGRRFFPGRPGKGDSIWLRVRVLFPRGFDFHASPWLKFLRVHTRAPDGTHEGYVDWLLHDPARHGLPFRYASEVGSGEDIDCGQVADAPQPDTWETYEMQVVLDDVPASKGGQGLARLWKDGKLLCEVRNGKTLRHADSVADAFLFSTTWNGGAPKDQSMWLDDVVITTQTPSKRDAAGHPMVGYP